MHVQSPQYFGGSAPLDIPIGLFPSKQHAGPRLPIDWKRQAQAAWLGSDERLRDRKGKAKEADADADEDEDEEDAWERPTAPWACAMVAWRETRAEKRKRPVAGGDTGVIAPADGQLEEYEEQEHVALGTADGSVWLFEMSRAPSGNSQQARIFEQEEAGPSVRASGWYERSGGVAFGNGKVEGSTNLHLRAASPTPSFQSGTSSASRRHHHAPGVGLWGGAPFAGFSPTSPSRSPGPSSLLGAALSPTSTHANDDHQHPQPLSATSNPAQSRVEIVEASVEGELGKGDRAEDMLEAQWHAGQRGGIRGALGLSPNLSHHHHHHHNAHARSGDGSPVPASRSREQSNASPAPSHMRRHFVEDVREEPREQITGTETKPTAVPRNTSSAKEAGDFTEQLHPRRSLQTPCRSRISGLQYISSSRLLTLQSSGLLTLWSTGDAKLITSTSLVPSLTGAVSDTSNSAVPATTAGSRPLAALAMLRGSSSTPTRVRTPLPNVPASGSVLATETKAPYYASLRRVYVRDVQKTSNGGGATHFGESSSPSSAEPQQLFSAWDSARRLLAVVDIDRKNLALRVRLTHAFPDAVSAPAIRLVNQSNAYLECFYVDDTGTLHLDHIHSPPPTSGSESLLADDSKSGAFEAAAAFFRRDFSLSRSITPEPSASAASDSMEPLPSKSKLSGSNGLSTEAGPDHGPGAPLVAPSAIRPASSSLLVPRSGSSTPIVPPGHNHASPFAAGAAAFFRRHESANLSNSNLAQSQLELPSRREWKGIMILGKKVEGIRVDQSKGDTILTNVLGSAALNLDSGTIGPGTASHDQDGIHVHWYDREMSQSTSSEPTLAVGTIREPKLEVAVEFDRLVLKCGNSHLWQSEFPELPAVTAILPLSLERVVIVLASGHARLLPLLDLIAGRTSALQARDVENAPRANGMVIDGLRTVANPRNNAKHVFGTSKQGDLVVWEASTLALQAEWNLFGTNVSDIASFSAAPHARLQGCVGVCSMDGTLAMILLDGLKLLYLVPGRGTAIQCVAVRGDDLLIQYADGRARVWDLGTHELRRSIGAEQARALIEDEVKQPWWIMYLGATKVARDTARAVQAAQAGQSVGQLRERGANGVLSPLPVLTTDWMPLVADLRGAIKAASKAVLTDANDSGPVGLLADWELDTMGRSTTVAGKAASASAHKRAPRILSPFLAALLPIGTSRDLDIAAAEILGEELTSRASVVTGSFSDPSFLAWSCSKGYTPTELRPIPALCLVTILNILSRVTEVQEAANRLSSLCVRLFATSSLEQLRSALPVIAMYLVDSSPDVQQAATVLFDAILEALPQAAIDGLCDEWQPRLPPQTNESWPVQEPLAVALLGFIAVRKYKLLSPALLKDVSSCISLYLSESASTPEATHHQAIAIELCCQGFVIWQHYLDAMDVVRSLFSLATYKDPASATGGGDAAPPLAAVPDNSANRLLARQATLQIAVDNTPLFMTTLSLDILHARSPAHCSATMRLVAFMVRRKPLILYPNLPRLAEAVVKSLDPTQTAMREAVVQAATVMISELVRTYRTISFHAKMQRLAVGTHEGAVIMYDLKTATRLYVIEGHRAGLSALDFSPDGRRLITVSLGDSKALIWKVGTSLGSFFTPGTLPRQGGTDESGAYKAIDFNIGHALNALPTESLEAVSLEWQGDRGVRLNVGDASMSFSVA